MADYTLATEKLAKAKAGGGLTPSLIQANAGRTLATGRIDPNAARINYVPSTAPGAVQDQTSAGINHVMQVTTKAAFEYQERESTFFANQNALEFEQYLNKEFYGYENADGSFTEGMSGSEGADSIRAHGRFTSKSNERFGEMLNGMEPRVRQKALIKMKAMQNNFNSYAAKHRSQQMEVAEDQQRNERLLAMTSGFIKDPGTMLGIDTMLGTSGKQRHNALFANEEDAKLSWSKTVAAVGSGIYTQEASKGNAEVGIAVVKGYYNSIADSELGLDFLTKAKMQSDITAWELKAVHARNYDYNQRKKVESDYRQENYRAGDLRLDEEINAGFLPDKGELLRRRKAGELSPERYGNVMARHYGNTLKRPEIVTQLEDDIRSGNVTERVDITDHPMAKYIDDAEEKYLIDLMQKVKEPDYNNRYNSAVEQMDGMFTSALGLSKLNDQMIKNQRPMARRDLYNKLKVPGMTAEQAIIELLPKYSTAKLALSKLPGVIINGTVAKPTNIGQVNHAVKTSHGNWQAGNLDDNQYYSTMLELARYRQTLGYLNNGTILNVNPATGEILNSPTNPVVDPETAYPEQTPEQPTSSTTAALPATTTATTPAPEPAPETTDVPEVTPENEERVQELTEMLDAKIKEEIGIEDFPIAPTPEETAAKSVAFTDKSAQLVNTRVDISDNLDISNFGDWVTKAGISGVQSVVDGIKQKQEDRRAEAAKLMEENNKWTEGFGDRVSDMKRKVHSRQQLKMEARQKRLFYKGIREEQARARGQIK